MMKLSLLHGALLLAVCLGSCWLAANAQEGTGDDREAGQLAPSARSRFVLPKIFDFGQFKQLFHKHYGSLIQELARQKLFLARAFEAFVSAVNYKHWKSDYHLGVNQFSDQTPDELDLRTNKVMNERNRDSFSHSPEPEVDTIEAADRQDIERELEIILEHRNEPGLKEAADEIHKSLAGTSRRKRQASSRDVSIEDLLQPQAAADKSKKIVRTIPSNNPSYEPIELLSYGTDDGRKDAEIPENEASFINNLPGAQFLSSMRDKLIAAFSGSADDGALQEEGDSGLLQVQSKPHSKEPVEPDEVYIDHRKSGCLFPARDQDTCGSCYIFSTIALLEWAHCKKTGKLVAFSEQYAIDCGFRFGLKGCDGGYEKDVIKFVHKYGLELASNYPYRSNEGTCPYPKDTEPKTTGYVRVKDATLKKVGIRILDKHLQQTPMLATVFVPPDFARYKGGVHPGKKCNREFGEHAMLLVGSGRQDGKEYWLFRNSYNEKWGENGYFKLNKESPCFEPMESATFVVSFDELGDTENADYKGFHLLKEHTENRDPDAPAEPSEFKGPVNDGQ